MPSCSFHGGWQGGCRRERHPKMDYRDGLRRHPKRSSIWFYQVPQKIENSQEQPFIFSIHQSEEIAQEQLFDQLKLIVVWQIFLVIIHCLNWGNSIRNWKNISQSEEEKLYYILLAQPKQNVTPTNGLYTEDELLGTSEMEWGKPGDAGKGFELFDIDNKWNKKRKI